MEMRFDIAKLVDRARKYDHKDIVDMGWSQLSSFLGRYLGELSDKEVISLISEEFDTGVSLFPNRRSSIGEMHDAFEKLQTEYQDMRKEVGAVCEKNKGNIVLQQQMAKLNDLKQELRRMKLYIALADSVTNISQGNKKDKWAQLYSGRSESGMREIDQKVRTIYKDLPYAFYEASESLTTLRKDMMQVQKVVDFEQKRVQTRAKKVGYDELRAINQLVLEEINNMRYIVDARSNSEGGQQHKHYADRLQQMLTTLTSNRSAIGEAIQSGYWNMVDDPNINVAQDVINTLRQTMADLLVMHRTYGVNDNTLLSLTSELTGIENIVKANKVNKSPASEKPPETRSKKSATSSFSLVDWLRVKSSHIASQPKKVTEKSTKKRSDSQPIALQPKKVTEKSTKKRSDSQPIEGSAALHNIHVHDNDDERFSDYLLVDWLPVGKSSHKSSSSIEKHSDSQPIEAPVQSIDMEHEAAAVLHNIHVHDNDDERFIEYLGLLGAVSARIGELTGEINYASTNRNQKEDSSVGSNKVQLIGEEMAVGAISNSAERIAAASNVGDIDSIVGAVQTMAKELRAMPAHIRHCKALESDGYFGASASISAMQKEVGSCIGALNLILQHFENRKALQKSEPMQKMAQPSRQNTYAPSANTRYRSGIKPKTNVGSNAVQDSASRATPESVPTMRSTGSMSPHATLPGRTLPQKDGSLKVVGGGIDPGLMKDTPPGGVKSPKKAASASSGKEVLSNEMTVSNPITKPMGSDSKDKYAPSLDTTRKNATINRGISRD